MTDIGSWASRREMGLGDCFPSSDTLSSYRLIDGTLARGKWFRL